MGHSYCGPRQHLTAAVDKSGAVSMRAVAVARGAIRPGWPDKQPRLAVRFATRPGCRTRLPQKHAAWGRGSASASTVTSVSVPNMLYGVTTSKWRSSGPRASPRYRSCCSALTASAVFPQHHFPRGACRARSRRQRRGRPSARRVWPGRRSRTAAGTPAAHCSARLLARQWIRAVGVSYLLRRGSEAEVQGTSQDCPIR